MTRTGFGTCPECGDVPGHMVDEGIGPYEFWGAKGVHHDWIPVCDECGEEMTEFEEGPFT